MRNERGSATVLVLTLLALLMAFAIGNSLVLQHLRTELKRVEHHQLEKFAPGTKLAPGMDKIRVIKLSLQCLRCGVLGLVPIIGLPFAVRAGLLPAGPA